MIPNEVLNYVQAAVLVIDAETHAIVDANPAATQLIGAARDQLVGARCHRFVCPTQVGMCPITDLCMTLDRSERVLLHADGTHVPVIKTVMPTIFDGRECLVETLLDLRERRQAEEALQRAHDELERRVQLRTAQLEEDGATRTAVSARPRPGQQPRGAGSGPERAP